jgi:hypothetical protein
MEIVLLIEYFGCCNQHLVIFAKYWFRIILFKKLSLFLINNLLTHFISQFNKTGLFILLLYFARIESFLVRWFLLAFFSRRLVFNKITTRLEFSTATNSIRVVNDELKLDLMFTLFCNDDQRISHKKLFIVIILFNCQMSSLFT